MRSRAFRRAKAAAKVKRRVKERQPWAGTPNSRELGRLREQPKGDCWCCKNLRQREGQSLQEQRFYAEEVESYRDKENVMKFKVEVFHRSPHATMEVEAESLEAAYDHAEDKLIADGLDLDEYEIEVFTNLEDSIDLEDFIDLEPEGK